jgi:hypothetical protein
MWYWILDVNILSFIFIEISPKLFVWKRKRMVEGCKDIPRIQKDNNPQIKIPISFPLFSQNPKSSDKKSVQPLKFD